MTKKQPTERRSVAKKTGQIIGFRPEPELRKRIEDEAWRLRITMGELLRRACAEYLAQEQRPDNPDQN